VNAELQILLITAASIGFIHTVIGPDHYVPFIVMAKSQQWSIAKTSLITFLCGIGHVLSSVILGFIGMALGVAVHKLEVVESFRGNLAGWALIAFGLAYTVWGIRRAIKNRPHKHSHLHADGSMHEHDHNHQEEHAHIHSAPQKANITPWILFTVFIFGPCEPLIPILMYPAAKNSLFGLIMVTSVFAIVTIGTMLGVVLVSIFGISFLPIQKLERYTHALAGATIFLCGVSIQFLGL
jgi:nickel/cobalt transporter (NicO) family protein